MILSREFEIENKTFVIEVKSHLEVEKERWNNLVCQSGFSLAFSCYEYYNIFDSGFFVICKQKGNDKYIGGIAGRTRTAAFMFKSIWIEMGVLLDSDYDDYERVFKKSILITLVEFAKRAGVFLINVNHWSRENTEEVFSQFNYIEEKSATFILDITQGHDFLWSNLSSKTRNEIKKGYSNKPEIKIFIGEEALSQINSFQEMRFKTKARASKNNVNNSMRLKSDVFLNKLFKAFGENSILVNIYIDKKLAATALVLKFQKSSVYYLGASDYNYRNARPSVVLQWEIIKHLFNQGVCYYDFGGVPNKPETTHPGYGVYKFKKQFKGEYKTYTSGKIVINRSKYFFVNKLLNNKFMARVLAGFFLKHNML